MGCRSAFFFFFSFLFLRWNFNIPLWNFLVLNQVCSSRLSEAQLFLTTMRLESGYLEGVGRGDLFGDSYFSFFFFKDSCV